MHMNVRTHGILTSHNSKILMKHNIGMSTTDDTDGHYFRLLGMFASLRLREPHHVKLNFINIDL